MDSSLGIRTGNDRVAKQVTALREGDFSTLDIVVDLVENMSAQIGAHCTIDSCNVLIEIFAVEINFRHNHIQGRGFCFDKSFYLMPILRLRSILVAGNDTPSGEVLYIRNQDIAFGKTGTVHGCVPPKS